MSAIRQLSQFLRIEANVPAELDTYLVMDDYGTHKTSSIKAWFAPHPRCHVHFTPTLGVLIEPGRALVCDVDASRMD